MTMRNYRHNWMHFWQKNLLSVTAPDDVTTSKSPKSAEIESLLSLNHGDNAVTLSNYARKEQGVTCSHDKPDGDVSYVGSKLDGADDILGSFTPEQLLPNAFDVTARCLSDYRPNSSPCQLSKHRVCHETLASSERIISNMNRNFHASCKIGTEPGCGDTIALVDKHFMKRAYCRFVRLDMQMWVVHSVDSMNYQHSIVLDYLGLVVLSIKVVGPTASTSFSFEANDTNLMKNFPNMDACTAVEFVFNAENKSKYAGPRTLVREIQVTSSLLGTLLDVFEEVQLAQIEFQNLTGSNFNSTSVEQLVLKLCFYNFIAERKVILELDMSCLKRGIYPSDILPFKLHCLLMFRDVRHQNQSYMEIKDAVKSFKTGYMRIVRLCSCVSRDITRRENECQSARYVIVKDSFKVTFSIMRKKFRKLRLKN